MANLLTSIGNKINSVVNSFRRLGSVVTAWGMWIREVWPDMNSRQAIDETYADNTSVYSIINRDCEKFASIPRYLYDAKSKRNDEYVKRVEEGQQVLALIALLDDPNPYQSQAEFLQLLKIFYDCCGEAIIWLNRGDVAQKYIAASVSSDGALIPEQFVDRTDDEIDRMPVIEMYVLAPGWVGIVPDPNNVFGISGYWLETGVRVPIRKGDILHWKRQNPKFDPTVGTHLRGLAPLQVGRRTVQENKDATAAMDRMFKNDGSKGVLVNSTLNWHALTEKQRQDYTKMIDDRINNNDVKGAVAMLGGNWDYKDISKRSVDEILLEGKRFTWQELCFLIGMPYELFDNKGVNFNTRTEVQKGWVSNVVMPQCRTFDQKLTKVLTKAFGLERVVVIWSDPSALSEYQKDMAALITAFNTAWYISPNRKLIALGFDPEDNELFNEPWIPQGFTPLSEAQNDINFNNSDQTQQDSGLNY